MKPYTYHSPNGDRTLFSKGANEDGTVDLVNADGILEIGKCPVSGLEGGCSPVQDEDEKSEGYASFSKADLVAHAATLEIDTSGMNKSQIIDAITKAESGEN